MVRLLRHERTVPAVALLIAAGAAWLWLARMVGALNHMPGAMPGMTMPTVPDLLLLALMWSIMMVAMMLPSASPLILLFASVQRTRRGQQRPAIASGIFAAGYLIDWIGFAVLAATLQWWLHAHSLVGDTMIATPRLGGALLIAGGVYQWSPAKQFCLTRCRSPLSFLTTEWREGKRGALIMGIRHGAFCLGCCWLLMALLFVAGVMNLLWVAALSALVLVEKILPAGPWVARVSGIGIALLGIWLLIRAA